MMFYYKLCNNKLTFLFVFLYHEVEVLQEMALLSIKSVHYTITVTCGLPGPEMVSHLFAYDVWGSS